MNAHIFSREPVEVITIIGKYTYFFDLKQIVPRDGQTVRILDSKLYYLNIVSNEGTRHRRIHRSFSNVEVKTVSRAHIQDSWLKQSTTCTRTTLLKACSLSSSIICFIDGSIERLVESYMMWLETCYDIANEGVKPSALIILTAPGNRAGRDVHYEFLNQCTLTQYRRKIYARHASCFLNTSVLSLDRRFGDVKTRDDSPISCINPVILHSIIGQTSQQHECSQSSRGYTWTEYQLHRLFLTSLQYYNQEHQTSPFSIARTMTNELSLSGVEPPQWNEFFSPLTASKNAAIDDRLMQLIGKYMGYHMLAFNASLEVENLAFSPNSDSGDTLFHFIFQERYQNPIQQILSQLHFDAGSSVLSSSVHAVRSYMWNAAQSYLSSGACITRSHITELQIFSSFFVEQKPHRLCTGCLFTSWDDILPCGHGFCKSCTHNFSFAWKRTGSMSFTQCPVCNKEFGTPFDVAVQPPTAGGRVLSLDGGGVKGIVQLEILHHLHTIIGQHIPIRRLFDLIIGTSIGNILDFPASDIANIQHRRHHCSRYLTQSLDDPSV